MKRADRIGAACAVIFGEEELARDAVTLRDLASGEQNETPLGELAGALQIYGDSRV
jgi:histidyl-tRNA synthetase